jgi:hypothetical protein
MVFADVFRFERTSTPRETSQTTKLATRAKKEKWIVSLKEEVFWCPFTTELKFFYGKVFQKGACGMSSLP